MKKRISFFIIFCMLTMILFSCKAKEVKENKVYSGKVSVYATLDKEVLDAIKDDFEKAYNGITLDYYSNNNDKIKRKLQAEFNSNQPYADVIILGNEIDFYEFKKNNWLKEYKSPEYKNLRKEFVDKENYYAAVKTATMGLMYNKSFFGGILENQIPVSWNTARAMDFKDKAVYTGPEKSDAAKYWILSLMQNDIGSGIFSTVKDKSYVKAVQGTKEAFDEINEGRANIGYVLDEIYISNKDESDLKFEFNYMESNNTTMITPIGLINNAQNEENGKLFIDYMVSKRGQELIKNKGLIPARTDIKSIFSSNKIQHKMNKKNIQDLIDNEEVYLKRYYDIIVEKPSPTQESESF